MNKKIILNVAIAAYNAEKNIKRLTQSILNQKEVSFILKQVIVNSDFSTDATVSSARSIKDKRLIVRDSNTRAGFAGALVNLVKTNDTDILLVLNDDIVILDSMFLEKLIKPFIKQNKIGLSCVNIQPFKSNNFVSESVRSGFNVYKKLGEKMNNGNNIFTTDGKALCLSKKFMSTIKFPKELKRMGNVDSYIYLECIRNKFNYWYAKEAIIFFRCPSTITDFIKWQTRNYQNSRYILKDTFGQLAIKEYKIPRGIFNYYKFIEFIKNPIGSIFILLIGIYCSYIAYKENKEVSETWDPIQSTKELNSLDKLSSK